MKVSIASGKGGTGKTTISTNLAIYISEYKKDPTVLVDLDVEEPNSGIFIKGETINSQMEKRKIPEWTKIQCINCGKCQELCNFNAIVSLPNNVMIFPELCHGCYACADLCPTNALKMIDREMGKLTHKRVRNLNFIDSNLNIGEEQAVPLIKKTQEYVDLKFSDKYLKLYDSPPGTSCPVIEVAKASDFIILVAEPTPFGFHDMKLSIQTMKELEKEFAVIINRYGLGYNKIENYLKKENIPVITKIPNLKEAARSYSKGNILFKDIPELKFNFEEIYKYIKKLEVNDE